MARSMVAESTAFSLRLQKSLSDQVKAIADRNFETNSTVLRRLVRAGLEVESRRTQAKKVA